MGSPLRESVRESLQQAIKDQVAEDKTIKPGSAAEALRLQNALKVKEKELDDVRKEVTALKSTLSTKDRALSQTEQELRVLREKNATTEGELASMAKELAALKVEKRKMEAQLANLTRRGDKDAQILAALGPHEKILAAANGGIEGGAFGSVPTSEHMASLQADLRMARLDGEKAAESIKVLENMLRAKDRHISALQRKADEGDAYRVKCGELENRLLDMNRQMDEMRAAARSAAETLRARDADNSRLSSDLAKARASLDAASEAAARSSAALKASEVRCGALEQEVTTLVTQLARTSAVAQRVAASEVKAGCKDEGVVHVTRYMEEMRFMGGEIARLQQRVIGLEKELAVSDELKEHYRTLSQPGGSPLDSSPYNTPSARSSRPTSALRRPSSTPRVRSALRMSAAVAASPTAATPTTTTAEDASSPTAPSGAAGTSGSSPTVRTSMGSTSLRRLSKPQPWNTPAKTAVTGTAVGGAGVLARSGAKVGPSVRTSPGATAAQRPRSTGSAAFKGTAAVRRSTGVGIQAGGTLGACSPGAAPPSVPVAAEDAAAASEAAVDGASDSQVSAAAGAGAAQAVPAAEAAAGQVAPAMSEAAAATAQAEAPAVADQAAEAKAGPAATVVQVEAPTSASSIASYPLDVGAGSANAAASEPQAFVAAAICSASQEGDPDP